MRRWLFIFWVALASCAHWDHDRDGDGVFDDIDTCPDVSGSGDDGCPPGPPAPDVATREAADREAEAREAAGLSDRDGDGVVDRDDVCPDQPEDVPGDVDGCPLRDADGDKIPDDVDACANAAEDKDGFQDGDGCPDPDNDNDGIPDGRDECPLEAETVNGLRDDDGCPDDKVKALMLDDAPRPTPTPTPTPVAPTPSPTPTPVAPTPVAPARAATGRAVASASQSAWVIAVMTIENSGASALKEPLRRGLTDQLRVFIASRRMKVVDRGVMEAAMREMMAAEKAKSYAACVDTACQIPLGKALAATHILRTTVGRFGASCTLNAELVDLAREVSVAAVARRSGCKDGELLDAAEGAVDELIRESQAP